MADRETVITHLQLIHVWAASARECNLQFFTAKLLEDIAQWTGDAIALLKKQESVSPTWQQGKAYCGSCGKRIPLKIGARFCHKCGQAVKWE